MKLRHVMIGFGLSLLLGACGRPAEETSAPMEASAATDSMYEGEPDVTTGARGQPPVPVPVGSASTPPAPPARPSK